ncbi:MAG: M42 family metallopeptidase [Thermofilum sp.]|uniref:M42 family peptidase n=1 Tax=Thermofilum pendens TaxID=2269 RepID=A0A7C4H0Q3_THEPE
MSLLSRLVNAPAPSGFEERVREIIFEELEEMGFEPVVDSLGNVYVILGDGRPLMVIAAHMDEVGFVVRHIDEKGFLRVAPLGGVSPEVALGKEVIVMGAKEDVFGVFGAQPPHGKGSAQVPLAFEDLFIDIGASSREEAHAMGVNVGTPVSFVGNYREAGGRVIGKALDDRVGCYALLEALRNAKAVEEGSVAVAFTVQEEVGLRGASVLAHELEPNYAIAVEGTIANDIPGVPEDRSITVTGKGPAIRVVDRGIIASTRLVSHIRQLAEERSIPYQLQVSPYSATDSGSFITRGAETSAISVPVRYIHTPASVAFKKDIDLAVQLLRLIIENPWPTEER